MPRGVRISFHMFMKRAIFWPQIVLRWALQTEKVDVAHFPGIDKNLTQKD